MVGKLFPDPFLKNQNWANLWIKSLKKFVFIVFQVNDWRNILKLSYRLIAFTSFQSPVAVTLYF